MKRILAHILPLLIFVACLASVAAGPARTAPPNKTDATPVLPDRNPLRVTASQSSASESQETADASTTPLPASESQETADASTTPPPASESASESVSETAAGIEGAEVFPNAEQSAEAPSAPDAGPMAAVSEVSLPSRNPKSPSMLGLPSAPIPEAAKNVTDVPLPAANPVRDGTVEVQQEAAAAPAMDYASILKPILSYDVSASDQTNIKRIRGSDFSAAKRIKDLAARDFALWYRYRHGKANGDAQAIEQFRLAHPDWPALDTLREKAEAALFLTGADTDKVKAFFSTSKPQTGAGKAALAAVYVKDGNETGARELVISAWRDHELNSEIEKKILDRYGKWLTAEHHRARIDRLLYPDEKGAIAAAQRVSKLLPADEQKKVAARIAVVQRGGNAGKLLDALPKDAIKADVGLRFNRIQWLRRTMKKDRREEAWTLLMDAPSEPSVLLDLNNWWIERRVSCRGALNDKKYKYAYEIAAEHGLVSGDSFIEAEFLAGWIALRYLSDPNTALLHFSSLRRAATSSRNIALGEYWLGRTALALGDRATAMVNFHNAAKYPQYFYGQLARQSLDPNPAYLKITSTPLPTEADIQRFLSRDGVRAIGVARAVGLDWVTPQFFLQLSRTLTNPAEVVLLAELAKLSDHQQIGLRLSKIAFNRDLPLGDYALPVGGIPKFQSLLTDRVDLALVHALSRQESEFNAAAKSPVGARGLMQLMPATARAVARAYKVKYSTDRLTNAAYNTQLGEAFLRDLIDSYNGSFFMALAAYNAGPGRVAEWIELFGDPRDPNVDPIDWIERIPFTETRRYVIKIMETLQLYRSRLNGPEGALQIVQDLNRGRRVPDPQVVAGVLTKSE